MINRDGRKKKKSEQLPRYVVIKHGQWHVRRCFATGHRDAAGHIIYEQYTRRCSPETPEAANALARAIEAEYRDRERSEPVVEVLGSFIERFLAIKRSRIALSTYELYRNIVKNHIQPRAIARLDVREVRPLDVQAFYTELADAHLSPAYIRKIHKFLSSVYNQAVRWKVAAENPTHGSILPKLPFAEVDFFDEAEARSLVRTSRLSGLEFVLFEFALETGMRPEEYLALRWQDLDLAKRTARVTRVVNWHAGGGFSFERPKTPASRRTVTFSEELAARLARVAAARKATLAELEALAERPLASRIHRKGVNYQKRRRSRTAALRAIANHRKLALVFPTTAGTPRSRANLNRREFPELLKRAGIDRGGHSLYTLRHTYATLMLACGVNPKVISERLGHRDVSTTLNTYAHVLPVLHQDASDVFASAIY